MKTRLTYTIKRHDEPVEAEAESRLENRPGGELMLIIHASDEPSVKIPGHKSLAIDLCAFDGRQPGVGVLSPYMSLHLLIGAMAGSAGG